jgi:uncharacterized protein
LALKDKIRLLFEIKDTPHRISLAFALGVFIGMSPLFGIHTVLGILLASAFGLNRLATIVGVYITNPWTIVPIYTFSTWVGAKCLGINNILPDINWKHISLIALLHDVSPLLMPFLVGTLLTGTISSLVSYIIIFRIAKRAHHE